LSADQDLQPAPRILKGILSRLQVKCDFDQKGCKAILSFESLKQHIEECAFNLVVCDKGCGLTIVKHKVTQHSCDSQEAKLHAKNAHLEAILQARNKQIFELERTVRDGKKQIMELERSLFTSLALVKEFKGKAEDYKEEAEDYKEEAEKAKERKDYYKHKSKSKGRRH